jgi:hypothetical protein
VIDQVGKNSCNPLYGQTNSLLHLGWGPLRNEREEKCTAKVNPLQIDRGTHKELSKKGCETLTQQTGLVFSKWDNSGHFFLRQVFLPKRGNRKKFLSSFFL